MWFAGGMAIPFLVLVSPAIAAPRQLFFQIVEYPARFRNHGAWQNQDMLYWNTRVASSSLSSMHALLFALLGGAGWILRTEPGLSETQNRELRLGEAVAIGLCAFLMLPRPTFAHYFVLTLPFVAILAVSVFSGS